MDSQQITSQVNQQIDRVKHEKWAIWLFIGLFGLAGCIFIYTRFAASPELSNHTPVVAEESKKAAKVAKKIIAGPKQLEIYDKQDLIKKIDLPPEVTNDQATVLTKASDIPKMPYGGTAIAYTNISSGKSNIALQANSRPIFEFGGKTQVGVLGGVSTQGNIAVGYVAQPIARVWGANLGVAGGAGVVGDKSIAGTVINISGEF